MRGFNIPKCTLLHFPKAVMYVDDNCFEAASESSPEPQLKWMTKIQVISQVMNGSPDTLANPTYICLVARFWSYKILSSSRRVASTHPQVYNVFQKFVMHQSQFQVLSLTIDDDWWLIEDTGNVEIKNNAREKSWKIEVAGLVHLVQISLQSIIFNSDPVIVASITATTEKIYCKEYSLVLMECQMYTLHNILRRINKSIPAVTSYMVSSFYAIRIFTIVIPRQRGPIQLSSKLVHANLSVTILHD